VFADRSELFIDPVPDFLVKLRFQPRRYGETYGYGLELCHAVLLVAGDELCLSDHRSQLADVRQNSFIT